MGLSFSDAVPEHSSLTRIRERLGVACFREVFERLVEQCREAGLVLGERVITDATLVESNASIRQMKRREEVKSETKSASIGEQGSEKTSKKLSNKTHVNRVDPDATLVHRPGCYGKLLYKVHYCADASKRVITDCHVTTGSCAESSVIAERIAYQRERLRLPIKEVMADTGYGTGKNYKFFESLGIRTYIPMRKSGSGWKQKELEKELKYDRRKDIYICTQGHPLSPRINKGERKYYRTREGQCKGCVARASCCLWKDTASGGAIYRSPYRDELERVRRRQGSVVFKKRKSERSWKIEGLFGEAKENHGLRRAKYRGLEKMQIQALMTGMAQNLKRLAASFCLYFYSKIFLLIPRFSSFRFSFGG